AAQRAVRQKHTLSEKWPKGRQIARATPWRLGPGDIQARREPNLQNFESQSAMQILVRENNVDQALRVLKKRMQREGIFREMKLRRNYEKPSERRARERAEAIRRTRKLMRKRMEREGY